MTTSSRLIMGVLLATGLSLTVLVGADCPFSLPTPNPNPIPVDNCPDDPSKTEPGLCGCGVSDADTNGDGMPDCHDWCPDDPDKVSPGACGCGMPDTDSDGDTWPDCYDDCPNDGNKTGPGQCGCGEPDTDSDADGIADCHDDCPEDPSKTGPGQCGCGELDTDSDADGIADCHDDCPEDPSKTGPGQCDCGHADTDADSDGIADCHDDCPDDPAKTSPGVCGCGVPESDTDTDGDNTPDCRDECPDDPTPTCVSIEVVTVGNSGNPADARYPHGDATSFGAVGYTYSIGKYEVTAGQYTKFLNAVAAADPYGLYSPEMWTSDYGCRIQRAGASGSYTYTVAANYADRPVERVSLGDAFRFANWLHNGQPTGAQDLTTTEDGSYYLNGAISGPDLLAVTREPDATWVIPTEDEWYKAAYHKNDGVTGNYFDYPTSSDDVPGYVNDGGELCGTSVTFADGRVDPGNYATYDGDGHPFGIGEPYYRTVVGEWENSVGPYGTFDQGGNVFEWNEPARGPAGHCIIRGGSFFCDGPASMHASGRLDSGIGVHADGFFLGFRLVKLP